MFCQAKSNYAIDVLVRAQTINTEKETLSTLAIMEKRIVNNLITICAQPAGVQGVRLVESVIRPDCCCDLSKAQDREDQCVKITYLKEQLRKKLQQNKQEFYDWKGTKLLDCLRNDFKDLLGFENYEEVLVSYKAWLQQEAQAILLENDDVEICRQQKSEQNGAMTCLENSKLMVKEIKSLQRNMDTTLHKLDATHQVILKVSDKVGEIHKERQYITKNVMRNVEKSIGTLLKLALEEEAEKQLLVSSSLQITLAHQALRNF